MEATTGDLTEGRFHAGRPTDLRRTPPWHHLAFIVRALPRTIEELSADLRAEPGCTVLDYGCAEAPYRRLFPADASYLAADLPGNEHATVELNADGTVPVPDGSCDIVLSTQALEHVSDPELYLSECHRVLRPGGRMLLTTHGVMPYHPDPVDYWRWTCAGLEREVTATGFEVTRFEGIMGLASCGLQLFQDGIYYHLPRPLHAMLALCVQSLIAGVERIQGPEGRRLNALVFALVAQRP
jgi:SAM-dependent methyltransferase